MTEQSCELVRNQVIRYIDDELNSVENDAIKEHSNYCVECFELIRNTRKGRDLIDKLPKPRVDMRRLIQRVSEMVELNQAESVSLACQDINCLSLAACGDHMWRVNGIDRILPLIDYELLLTVLDEGRSIEITMENDGDQDFELTPAHWKLAAGFNDEQQSTHGVLWLKPTEKIQFELSENEKGVFTFFCADLPNQINPVSLVFRSRS